MLRIISSACFTDASEKIPALSRTSGPTAKAETAPRLLAATSHVATLFRIKFRIRAFITEPRAFGHWKCFSIFQCRKSSAMYSTRHDSFRCCVVVGKSFAAPLAPSVIDGLVSLYLLVVEMRILRLMFRSCRERDRDGFGRFLRRSFVDKTRLRNSPRLFLAFPPGRRTISTPCQDGQLEAPRGATS